MECPQCHAANPDGPDVGYCRGCGASLAPERSERSESSEYGGYTAATPGFGLDQTPTLTPAYANAAGGETMVVPAANLPYAGFWTRVVANLIDGFVTGIVMTVIAVLFGVVGAFSRNGQEFVFLSAYAFMMLLSLAYYVALPPILGATPGKLALGYMIVGPDGRKMGFGRSLGRYLGYIISAVPLYLGFIWVGIDAYKQGWHDKIAGTFVVRKEFVQL